MRPGRGDRPTRGRPRRAAHEGSSLAALMVAVAVLGILATAAARQWSFITRRELEKELHYRGSRIMNAVFEYRSIHQRLPSKLEDMTKPPRPTLRKVWADPMTARYDKSGELVEGTGEWELLEPETVSPGGRQGGRSNRSSGRRRRSSINVQGVVGVASKSQELSLTAWEGRPPGTPYSEWKFEVANTSQLTGRQRGSRVQGNTLPGFPVQPPRPPGFGGVARPPGAPPPARAGGPPPGLGADRRSRR